MPTEHRRESCIGTFNYHSSSGVQQGKAEENFKEQARTQMYNELVHRPGTAYVEYIGQPAKVAEHGKMYIYAGEENFKFTNPISTTHSGSWDKTETVEYSANFDVDTI
ncbi:hypothetical protein INT46_009716 [Mucor plumbeus]|uniref:Uncharacterized protein n=1 Tax=Mucor plumbeus TaxID=97098 RepID=A0A8H7RIC6_9FUNG|nr:hypothetical protein INT46_009715 [Mucor plumbeus]KAG2210178.1 hypothetical protein INT46_009716 [Mucor plumbeus]